MITKEYNSEIIKTIKLAVPVSIGQLGHIMMGVVDSMMVGKIGSVPLAASSLVNGIFFLILVIGLGITFAVTPLTAIGKGSNKKKECGIILREGFIVTIFTSLVLIIILIIASNYLYLLNQPEGVTIEAESYLKILAYSVLPMLLFQNHRSFLEGLSKVHPPMYIAIFANLTNAFFNWIFIYGNLNMPALGLTGAGYATFFTRFLMAFTLIYYVHSGTRFKDYLVNFFTDKINYKTIKKILEIGLPTGFQFFFEVSAFAFAAVMIGWFGSSQLAAHQIAINLASITFMVILGISAAGTIRVADALGQKNELGIRRAGFAALAISFSIMFFMAILFFIFRNDLPKFYNDEIEVIKLAAQLLIIAGFFQIFDGTQATALGVLRGLKDTKIPMIVTFIAYWIFGIPIGYLLGFVFNFEAVGVWVGLSLSLAIVAIALTYRFNKKSHIIVNH